MLGRSLAVTARTPGLAASLARRGVSKLSEAERKTALRTLPQWEYKEERDAIVRKFEFGDFKQAWRFMDACAKEADWQNHHPEWFNVYNRVEVLLTTHDCSGLSEKDIALATAMDKLFASPPKPKPDSKQNSSSSSSSGSSSGNNDSGKAS